ncbi:hypothetical protein FOBRF1_011883 [Fusarium oxysporum]
MQPRSMSTTWLSCELFSIISRFSASKASSQTPPRVTQPDATSWATSFRSSLVARGLVGTTVSRLISSIAGS